MISARPISKAPYENRSCHQWPGVIVEEKIEPLSEDDITRLENQRSWVRDYFEPEARHKYDTIEGKLYLIDAILKNNWISAKETWKLQSLGVVFGDTLVQSQGFKWVMIEDEYGRDPTICVPGTTIKLHALTMISKRVEDGEEVDVFELFDLLCERVEELKREFPIS